MLIGLTLAAIVALAILFVALPVGHAMWSAYRAPVPVRCPYARCDVTVRVGRAGVAEALGMTGLRRIDECVLRQDRWLCRDSCLASLPDLASRA
jgi:hypothetical protein